MSFGSRARAESLDRRQGPSPLQHHRRGHEQGDHLSGIEFIEPSERVPGAIVEFIDRRRNRPARL